MGPELTIFEDLPLESAGELERGWRLIQSFFAEGSGTDTEWISSASGCAKNGKYSVSYLSSAGSHEGPSRSTAEPLPSVHARVPESALQLND